MIINNQTRLLVLGIAMTILSGCAISAAGGAAAGATASIDRRTAGAIIEDQTIELKAYAAIQQDGKLDEQTHISVTSYNGRVLITGEAPLAEMKQKITDLVSNINKVLYKHWNWNYPKRIPSDSESIRKNERNFNATIFIS